MTARLATGGSSLRRAIVVVAVVALAPADAGCGAGGGVSSSGASEPVPGYVSAPPTHEQRLVEKGAQLVVADGCTACHLPGHRAGLGPNFGGFAGHRVTLRDGRRVLVDQRYLQAALAHPGALSMRGYDPRPMAEVVEKLGLARRPGQIAALAAFIEQVGPETE